MEGAPKVWTCGLSVQRHRRNRIPQGFTDSSASPSRFSDPPASESPRIFVRGSGLRTLQEHYVILLHSEVWETSLSGFLLLMLGKTEILLNFNLKPLVLQQLFVNVLLSRILIQRNSTSAFFSSWDDVDYSFIPPRFVEHFLELWRSVICPGN